MVHIREDVEQHCILELLVGIHQALNAKADEFVIADVGVSIEELAFSTDAHGVESKAEFTEEVFGEERLRAFLVLHILILYDGVQVSHDGIVLGFELVIVGVIMNAELAVEPCQKDFKCIDLSVIEILVDSEEVLEVGDVLGEASCLAECFGCIVIHIIGVVRPLLGFKRINDILATHEVNVATSEVVCQILILLFRVKAEDGFAGHSRVGKNELEKIRLTLSGVTEDEDVGVRLVIASAVKVHDDVCAELISAEIESVGIRLTRIVERVAVCNSRCWKDSFKLCTEYVVTARHTGDEPFLLSEGESVHRELFSRHLHRDVCLKLFELVKAVCGQLDKYSAMQKRLTVFAKVIHQLDYIVEVTFAHDRVFEVVGVRQHLVFAAGVLQDLSLFESVYESGVHVKGYGFLIPEARKDSLIRSVGRIFLDCPNATEAVATYKVIDVEFDGRGYDHVEEVFHVGFA